jgi:glycosyltransferase involved in cell wall biosynthesis
MGQRMEQHGQAEEAARAARSLSVLVVHSELPLHDRHSGSLRLRRYVEVMVAEGHRVTYLARSARAQKRYAEELLELGVEVCGVDSAMFDAARDGLPAGEFDLGELLHRGRFDVAYLNFYELAELFLPAIRAHSPATRIIIDTHDVHYLRERRGAELSGDAAALAAAERTREREAAIYAQTDLLTAVSVDDAQALNELAPGVPVEIVTNVHVEVEPGPGFNDRAGLVFVANYAHTPNVDAVLDFWAHSWPAIAAALPDVSLTLVGYAPPPTIEALAGERVTVTGQVPEVAPFLDAARISIAPLRYGAGVKGKIGEALMHGLPVVTTPIGAEGMELVDGEHALIADPGADFAAAVIRLYGDGELWAHMAASGREHVRGRHSVDAAVASLRRAFAIGVPRCLLVRGGDWSDAALDATLGDYLEAYRDGDPVTLVVPVTPADPTLQVVGAKLAAAIERAGRDPEQVPDIAVMPCVGVPPLPTCATYVDVAFAAAAS